MITLAISLFHPESFGSPFVSVHFYNEVKSQDVLDTFNAKQYLSFHAIT